jgi:hypothetical protein
MATVSRELPARPHLDVPRREARNLLQLWRQHSPEAFDRIRGRHPKFRHADDATLKATALRLSDAQLVVAREYGSPSWAELKRRIESSPLSHELRKAIHADDQEAVVRLLTAHPGLLHLPVWSANWGPPMSHAANLGHLDLIKAIAALGARDFQHAFDRALLQGRIETARWLHAQGATLAPGIVMGACETLNADGLRFLVELNAPFTNAEGDRLAPLALVLETYARNPGPKHEVLRIFADQGYPFPDTPMVAFHRGDLARLETFLRRDPELVHRRFTLREIYPAELGCGDAGRAGMHGTPIDGTTLLHLAIDFDEQEIFELLLSRGADVNAHATIDAAGFGGHTPLFNAVVSCAYTNGRQRDAAMTRTLLTRGASPNLRASVRKFLDWREEPGWYEAREVTPAEWARDFPERGWVSVEALELLK